MDNDYSKREIDEHFRAINEKIDHGFSDVAKDNVTMKGDISELVTLQRAANGNIGNLKAWRTGIGMCVALLSFIILPLIVYSFHLSQENLKNTILIELKKNV